MINSAHVIPIKCRQYHAERPHLLGMVGACIVMVCSMTVSCIRVPEPTAPAPPRFDITVAGKEDKVAVDLTKVPAVLNVQSQLGIGTATVQLISGEMPKPFVIGLHLQGLEGLELTYDEIIIKAQAIVSDGGDDRNSSFQSIILPGGGEEAITTESPYWLDLHAVSTQTPPQLPLTEGYFEFSLPTDFWEKPRRSFVIRWVDFYR